MDENARKYARIVQRDGTSDQVIKELIPGLRLEKLKEITMLCNAHVTRMSLFWGRRGERQKITELSDGRLYQIIKGNYGHTKVLMNTLKLEAEMRGFYVGNVLTDPSIDYGQRQLPYGLLDQCKD